MNVRDRVIVTNRDSQFYGLRGVITQAFAIPGWVTVKLDGRRYGYDFKVGELAPADRVPVQRCEANARRGTGTGACDLPLDEHGYCPRPNDHIGGVTP